MSTLQEQARALGDPTRYAVFRYLADAADPVGVAELTDHLGLNHNAIRQHLAKLVAADLVVEEQGPAAGRGRPPLQYRVDPGADGRWEVTGPYERLSGWLSQVIRSGDPAVEVGRREGSGRPLSSASPGDPVSALVDEMARQGFEPAVRRRGTKVDVVLHRCPFVSAAAADPDTVCDLHLGIAQGVAGQIEGLEVEELVRRDPVRAGCVLRARLGSEPTPG